MEPHERSPRISSLSWGSVEIDGRTVLKDAKLYPGRGREWNWRETGTRHVPGIQPAHVAELLDHGATVVILSTGIEARLGVHPDTLPFLAEKGIAVHVLQTEAAVQLYNELRERDPVGGLFHSTC